MKKRRDFGAIPMASHMAWCSHGIIEKPFRTQYGFRMHLVRVHGASSKIIRRRRF